MNINDIRNILTRYNFSALHDYDDKSNYISMLGIFEEELPLIQSKLSNEWIITEKRRNPDNNFLRVDIIKAIN
jgi:hypothetical protein